jgi:hypothetical protein
MEASLRAGRGAAAGESERLRSEAARLSSLQAALTAEAGAARAAAAEERKRLLAGQQVSQSGPTDRPTYRPSDQSRSLHALYGVTISGGLLFAMHVPSSRLPIVPAVRPPARPSAALRCA